METCRFIDFIEVLKPWLNRDYVRKGHLDGRGNFTLFFADGGEKAYRVDDCSQSRVTEVIEMLRERGIPVELRQSEDDDIDSMVSAAIACHLGDIGTLPEAVRTRIRSVYQPFFTAYAKISRLKEPRQAPETDPAALDPDVLAYMRHFFSDYQHIFRRFRDLNRRAQALLQIDREKYPEEFRRRSEALLDDSGRPGDSAILEEILTPPREDG
jgi:hypothetical protein